MSIDDEDGVPLEDSGWQTEPDTSEEDEDFAEFYGAVTIHAADERYQEDFIRLPGLIATYGRTLAKATRALLTAKREYEHAAARLYGAKRKALEEDPEVDTRVTEGRIDAAVRADPRWLAARKVYDDASADKSESQARFDALKSKETALQSLSATYRAEAKIAAH